MSGKRGDELIWGKARDVEIRKVFAYTDKFFRGDKRDVGESDFCSGLKGNGETEFLT